MNDTITEMCRAELKKATVRAFDGALAGMSITAALDSLSFSAPNDMLIRAAEYREPVSIRLIKKHAKKRAVLMQAMANYIAQPHIPTPVHWRRALDVMASRGYLGKEAQAAVASKIIWYPLPPRLENKGN